MQRPIQTISTQFIKYKFFLLATALYLNFKKGFHLRIEHINVT
jgi:hypothetical protein